MIKLFLATSYHFLYIQLSSLNLYKKQGPQGPQKLSSIKTFKIQNPLAPKSDIAFSLLQRIEIDPLSNSRWQTVKELQIDPQTTELCSKQLNVTLSVSELGIV